MTRELPILYSPPMVRACLAGVKTQTRRLPPRALWGDAEAMLAWGRRRFGEVGDAETERLLRDGLPKLIRLVSLAYKEGVLEEVPPDGFPPDDFPPDPPDRVPPDDEDDDAVHAHLEDDGTEEYRPADIMDELPPRRPGPRSR